ncbi:MAG TPA: cysteine--tRNA ligase [Candidatus Tyrphobacter sp.]
MLKLYNTRTRTVEPFEPLRGNDVRIYVCGLTPSAQAHLGHARSFLFFDVLRRYLEHKGYDVTYVQNVTDIDDRSIAAAREENATYREIIDRHYAAFKAAMRRFDVREPDVEPYATAYIPQIQSMIRELLERGHAYVAQDGIYYAVKTFARYGSLSRRNVDELEAGARVEVGEHKHDPLDFALWKFAKPAEPSWAFEPYAAGRPGWHIECSAMSRTLLDPPGNGFDIHGGGADLIFPHHENEIAQSEPLMPHPPMSNFWVHGGLLLFDSRKMSKSLGNFEPLSAVVERHDPQALRLLFLRTGYRKVMNFTEESISSASADLESLRSRYRALSGGERLAKTFGGLLLKSVEAALDDDMNTAVALAAVLKEPCALDEFVTALRILGLEPNAAWLEEAEAKLSQDFIPRLEATLAPSTSALRAYAQDDKESGFDGVGAEEAIARVISWRTKARASKDWTASDRLRDALAACGITLHDGKDGTTWSVAE